MAVSANTYAEFGPRGLKGWPGREQFSNERQPYEVEDLATAFIRLDSGATLLLEASWGTHSAAGDDFGVTLYGTEGGVELMVRNYTYDDTVRIFTDIGGMPTDLTPKIAKGDGGHTAGDPALRACHPARRAGHADAGRGPAPRRGAGCAAIARRRPGARC